MTETSSVKTKKYRPLTGNEPAGYYQGSPLHFWVCVVPLIIVHSPGLLTWKLYGKENLQDAEKAVADGKSVTLALNHISRTDTYIPQFILLMNGFYHLMRSIFYVISLDYFRGFFNFVIKSLDRVPIVQSRLRPSVTLGREGVRGQLELVRRVNEEAKRTVHKVLANGRWILLFPEGTRQLNGLLGKPEALVLDLYLKDDGSLDEDLEVYFLPMALVGTDKMWPPQSKTPAFRHYFSKVSLFVGQKVSLQEIWAEAKTRAIPGQVDVKTTAAEIIMEKIADLLKNNGYADKCQRYNLSLAERYPPRFRRSAS